MTIIGKKKDAKVVKASEIRDVISIHEVNGETVCLVKVDEAHATWVKVEKQAKGVRIK